MPLFAYFGVVGAFLLCLLFVAEAQLGPPTSLSISTNFYGLPAPYKAPSAPILTVRDAPAPPIASAAAAQPEPALSQPPILKIRVTKAPSKPKKKQVTKTARQDPGRNLFAEGSFAMGKSHRVW